MRSEGLCAGHESLDGRVTVSIQLGLQPDFQCCSIKLAMRFYSFSLFILNGYVHYTTFDISRGQEILNLGHVLTDSFILYFSVLLITLLVCPLYFTED